MIAHIVVAGEVGGAERMLIDLAAQPDHFVILMTPSERLRALLKEKLDVVDRGPASEDTIAFLRRTLGPRDVAFVADTLKKRGATVVHLHTFGSQVIGTRAALRVGARIVRTEHSTRVFDDPSCWPFARWSLKKANVSVAISEHVKEVASAKAPWASDKMFVIPNGVDTARFRSAALPSGETIRLVAVGRLEPRKGFDLAIEAIAKVPSLSLSIVGDGDSRAALEALVTRLGVGDRVSFVGYQEDVRDAIENAHLAFSTSRKEGLGIALLEAMAMGRPVVALPTGGIPEFVDARTGWLAKDAADLERTLREATANLEAIRERGANAAALVRDRYSIDGMRARYRAMYAR